MSRSVWILLLMAILLGLAIAGCGSTPTPLPTAMPSLVPAGSDPTPLRPTGTPTRVLPTDTPTLLPLTSAPALLPPTDTLTPVPAADTSTPTSVPATVTPQPPAATIQPQPTAAATQAEPSPSPPATQGCYLFQNFLGADVTVTFTAQDRQWNDDFVLAPNGETIYCLDPGRYTYTLDAPPPWGATNGELVVQVGDRYLFPIRGRE